MSSTKGDGAPPVRDDRTWTIGAFAVKYDRMTSAGPVPAEDEVSIVTGSRLTDGERVEVVPRSELVRVQGELDQERESNRLFLEQELDRLERVLTGQLDQAREALSFYARQPGYRGARARAALAASGVTQKGDE